MRQKLLITVALTLTLAFFSPMLVSSSCTPVSVEQHDTLYIERETVPDRITLSTYEIPEHVEFCGKDIDLTRFDRRERMDRELLAFMYMHSTSIQMIKRANRYFPVVESILKENGYPPYEFVSPEGKPTGFDIELMEAIAAKMGVEVEWFCSVSEETS